MKTIAKISYIIFLGILILSSCSQEEAPVDNPDGNDRRIVFHTSLPVLTTRASEITELSYFILAAFDETDPDLREDGKIKEYIDRLKIEINSDKILSDRCVWPKKGHESDLLHFFAYYPELPEGAMEENNTSVKDEQSIISYKIKNFSIFKEIANQVDFVAADTTGSMAKNLFSGVKLNFNHQLSRIEVKAKGANKTCNIEIAGVRIGGVGVKGDFDFLPEESKSVWSNIEKGAVEYIFSDDDELVMLPLYIEGSSTEENSKSIMGKGVCAMVIPCGESAGWDYKDDKNNSQGNMYISVLLRVTDANGEQQYPYTNTDPATESEIKEYGWAALPITGNWQPGYIYTYTLDYSYGVGLRDPNDDTHPGESIISDKVLVDVKVSDWKNGDLIDDVKVPRK